MRSLKWLFLACLVGSSFLLTGAFGRQDVPIQGTEPSSIATIDFVTQSVELPESWNDPRTSALTLLDRVIASLQPEHIDWLELRLWQQGRTDGSSYCAEGRAYLAPRERGRLELDFKGSSTIRILCISDGQGWVRKIDLDRQPLFKDSGTFAAAPVPQAEPLRRAQFRNLGFNGLLPLLTELRDKARDWALDQGVWKQRPCLRLTGTWPGNPESENEKDQAVQVRVFLDGPTLWPHRLEWLDSQQQILLALEFRDPIVNQPLSDADCQRLFHRDPS